MTGLGPDEEEALCTGQCTMLWVWRGSRGSGSGRDGSIRQARENSISTPKVRRLVEGLGPPARYHGSVVIFVLVEDVC